MEFWTVNDLVKLNEQKSLSELNIFIEQKECQLSESKTELETLYEIYSKCLKKIECEQEDIFVFEDVNIYKNGAISVLDGFLFQQIESRKRFASELLQSIKLLDAKITNDSITIKKLKSVLKYLHKKLSFNICRDLRLSFRNLVRTLFKTFDSTSGSDNKIVFQLSNYDFINQKTSLVCLTKNNLSFF